MKKITKLSFLIVFLFALFANMSAANVTVRFKAPSTWEQVSVYTWGPQVTASWPGDDVTATKDADGFCSFTYDDASVTTGIHIMFNNTLEGVDALEKTDIYHTAGNACYEPTTAEQVADGKQWGVTMVDCPGVVIEGNTTVRFKAPEHWEKVMIYTYSPESGWGFWDKELFNKDSEGYYSFTFDLTTASINVMFHNGKAEAMEQTDIFIEKTGTSCFVPDALSGVNLSVTEVDCGGIIEPEGNTTVRFQAPSHWERVMIYTYSPEQSWGFWDKELTNKDSEGYYSFTFDLTTASINVMFHNGKAEAMEQTDIFIEKTGTSCFIPDALSGVALSVTEVDCGSSSLSEETGSALKVYPNPTAGYVYLNSDVEVKNVDVYNSMGKLMQAANKVQGGIDLTNLPAGLYLISVTLKDGAKETVSIIKQ